MLCIVLHCCTYYHCFTYILHIMFSSTFLQYSTLATLMIYVLTKVPYVVSHSCCTWCALAFVPRCKLTSTEGELPFVLTRRQFPATPCFAMTIIKSQGQTLDRVGIFFRRPVFSHGQLYVAVSRPTSRQNLRFMVIGGGSTLPDGSQGTSTTNTVYQRVLNGSGRR